jgi:hypothetical protein
MEEKMQWYELTPREKYGINEILNFVNTEKKILMRIDINWKRGMFHVLESPDGLIPNWNQDGLNLYDGFDECQLDHVTDGHEEYSFHDLNSFEEIEGNEYTQSLIDGYLDEGVNHLDEQGFLEEDPEIYITGGFLLEETDPPY